MDGKTLILDLDNCSQEVVAVAEEEDADEDEAEDSHLGARRRRVWSSLK